MRRRQDYDPEHTTDEEAYQPPRSRRRVEHDEKQPERKVQYTTAENVGAIATGLEGLGMLPPPRPPAQAHPVDDWVHGVLTRSTLGHVQRLPADVSNQIAEFVPHSTLASVNVRDVAPESLSRRWQRLIQTHMERVPIWHPDSLPNSNRQTAEIARAALHVRDYSLPAAERKFEFKDTFPELSYTGWNEFVTPEENLRRRISSGLSQYYPHEQKGPVERASYAASANAVLNNITAAHDWAARGIDSMTNASWNSRSVYAEISQLHPIAQRHFLMSLPENVKLEMERLGQREHVNLPRFENYNPDFPTADTARLFRRGTR